MDTSKIYVEYAGGMPLNIDFYAAMKGADALNIRVIPVEYSDIEAGKYAHQYHKHPFVLSTRGMVQVFTQTQEPQYFGVRPTLDHRSVEKALSIYGRDIFHRTNQAVAELINVARQSFIEEFKGCYMKPAPYRVFQSFEIRQESLSYLRTIVADNEAGYYLISDPIYDSIVSEWRVYVRNKRIVDIRPYSDSGDRMVFPDKLFIRDVIEFLQEDRYPAICNYALDIGITSLGKNFLMEPSDFWAIAHYGMQEDTYVSMLIERYEQIMG